jgi:hypothetical protein
MDDKISARLYKIGLVLLKIFGIYYVFFGIFVVYSTGSMDSLGHVITNFIIVAWPSVILLPAIFLVKKYTLVVGTIFIGLGVFISLFITFDVFSLLLFLLEGLLFLISGLLNRRNKKNAVTNQP